MKRVSFFFFLVSIISLLNAQLFDLSFINHSGITPTDHIHLRALALEELNMFDVTIEAVSYYDGMHYSTNFNYVNMFEQKAILKASSETNSIGFRLRTNIDMISVIVPWAIEPDQTTMNDRYLLAGEAEIGNVENANLDIKSHSLALLPNSLAFMLENVSGDFPTQVGNVLLPNQLQLYFYGALLINPEALIEAIDFENLDLDNLDIFEIIQMLGDINVYAALYMNINLVIYQVQSGLKKLPVSMFTDPSSINPLDLITMLTTSIGDIDPSINDGRLMMKIDLLDLISDPDFGSWPGLTNSLVIVPIAFHIVGPISSSPTFNFDYGVPTLAYCDSYQIVHSTDLPNIELGNETPYTLQILYSQNDGLFPAVAEFQNENNPLQGVSTSSNFMNTASFLFTQNTPFTDGTFVFSADSLNFVELDYFITADSDVFLPPENYKCSVYPNPFNPETTISLALSSASNLKIDIYNLKGQKIKTIIDDFMPAGSHKFLWNGTNDNGIDTSSGVYFIKIQTPNYISVKKAILMK